MGKKTVRKRSVWVKKKLGYSLVTKQFAKYNCNLDTVSTPPELSNLGEVLRTYQYKKVYRN